MNVIKYPENTCPLCESNRNKFRKDYFRDEVYCGVCGCVLRDNSLPRISMIEFLLSLDQEDNDSDVNDDKKIF